ncbi:redoxin family protein [Chitinophaga sp. HK235]|uniref:TlpA family protein disulfide reductase n=1 Tax=Chitinophaga sp. HK235 TaxID=2952571 RepID=UPI001BAA2D2A|nr:redoxin family protein [Chitinophaga sp. HK235]
MKIIQFIVLYFLFVSTVYAQSNIKKSSRSNDLSAMLNERRNARLKAFIGQNYFKLTNADSILKDIGIDKVKGVNILNFWFANCPPCIVEFLDLVKLGNRFFNNSNFHIISLTYENDSIISSFQRKYSLPFTPMHISKESCVKMNLQNGFPTNILLDSTGAIVLVSAGGSSDSTASSKLFQEVLMPAIDSLLGH